MDLQAEKIELVKLLFETQKESLIKKNKALLKEDNESSFKLPQSQKEKLDWTCNKKSYP